MSDLSETEALLLSFLRGEHSSLSITFNDCNGPNYQSVKEHVADFPDFDVGWVSDDERKLAIKNNSWWRLQWYPETPVGFCVLQASSLEALIAQMKRLSTDP